MSSTKITDFIAYGTHAARPATPNVGTGCSSVYFETDTNNAFVWTGSAWAQLNGIGTTLGSDTDVALSGLANGQVLTYNGGTSKWVNQAAGASSPVAPFGIVQFQSVTSPGSTTLTFQQTATAGNALLAIISTDSGDTVTTPAGYTLISSKVQAVHGQVLVYLKSSASGAETSIVFTGSNTGNNPTYDFFELSGAHSLDQQAVTSIVTSNNQRAWIKPSAITPASGAMVFAAIAYAPSGNQPGDAMVANGWRPLVALSLSGARHLSVFIYNGSGAGASIQPPIVGALETYSTSDGVVASTFSIL